MPENPLIILTREPEDNKLLAKRLSLEGRDFVEYPCIKTVPVSSLGNNIFRKEKLVNYNAVIFTSKRAVKALESLEFDVGKELPPVAVVGRRTADEVRRVLGMESWIVAEPPTAESLARILIGKCPPAARFLHIRGSKSTGVLKKIIYDYGFHLDEVIVYKHESMAVESLRIQGTGIVVLASPSAARYFLKHNSGHRSRLAFLAIGSTTAEYLRKMKLSAVYKAKNPEIDSLLEEIIKIIKQHDFTHAPGQVT